MISQRLRLLPAAVVLPAALALGACGGGESSPSASGGASPAAASSAASAPASGELAKVTVTPGKGGAVPKITVPSRPFTLPQAAHRVVRPGTGTTLTGEHKAVVKYVMVNGRDGKVVESLWDQKATTRELSQIPQFGGLIGQKVGAQVLFAIPAKEAFGPQGQPRLGVKPDDTLLYVLEPVGVAQALKQAQGTPVPPKAGLPMVKMGATPKDPATFTLPKGAPPKKTVAQPLITGTGPKVTSGQTVRVSYTGVTWREPSKPFDYSGRTPQGYAEFAVGQGQLIKAWDEHLVGQSVGTRLLLIVPPADGYGAAGRAPAIKGDDTLVFVLDILDAN